MSEDWRSYVQRFEELARRQGLDFNPIEFEAVPDSFMTEIAVYGLPVRMPHWSFGVRYIHQLVQRRMGNSRLFEVVFPGNPGHAFLSSGNAFADNVLVTAHVLGHGDFSRNNLLFQRSQAEVSDHIVEHAASHARQIEAAIESHGALKVEAVLDAALSLEQYVDVHAGLGRADYPEFPDKPRATADGAFLERFAALDPAAPAMHETPRRAPIPPHPERDLLWFIARHGPDLEPWERDIFLAVREESFYFYPVFATQIMNEGWASYWHARLLREADFVPQQAYLDAIRCHSDVVRPFATGAQLALALNPYHLGFSLWERIVAERGVAEARRMMREEDDFSFVRNALTPELAEELGLFRYSIRGDSQITIGERDIDALREEIVAPKFNFGAPNVAVTELRSDGTLELRHDHVADGRGLDVERANRVLEYLGKVWRRAILLHTVDESGRPLRLSAPAH